MFVHTGRGVIPKSPTAEWRHVGGVFIHASPVPLHSPPETFYRETRWHAFLFDPNGSNARTLTAVRRFVSPTFRTVTFPVSSLKRQCRNRERSTPPLLRNILYFINWFYKTVMLVLLYVIVWIRILSVQYLYVYISINYSGVLWYNKTINYIIIIYENRK